MIVQQTDDRLQLLATVLGGAASPQEWLEARIALLAAQGMSMDEIAEIVGVALPIREYSPSPAVPRS